MKAILRVSLMIPAWVLLGAMVPLQAQIKTHFYHSEHFGIEQGLDHGVIGDMYVDENGFVWIYTIGNIQLFDGHQFRKVNHPVDEPAFTGMFNASQSGSVFFLTPTTLYRLAAEKGPVTRNVKLEFPVIRNPLRRSYFLYENPSHLFVSHFSDTVYMVRKVDMSIEQKFILPVPMSIYYQMSEFDVRLGLDDKIEYIGDDLNLYQFDLSTHQLDTFAELDIQRSITKIARDTFIVLEDDSLHVMTRTFKNSVSLPDTTLPISGRFILPVSSHEVIIASYGSIYTFDIRKMRWISRFQKTAAGNFFDFNLRKMQTDGDKNIYLTTFTSGLVKLYPRNPGFQYLGSKNESKQFVRNISGSDINNVVLMGTLLDGLYVYDTTGNIRYHFIEFPGKASQPYIAAIVKVSPSRFIIITQLNVYELNIENDVISINRTAEVESKHYNYYSSTIEGNSDRRFFMTSWDGLTYFDPDKNGAIGFMDKHPLKYRFAAIPFRGGYLGTGYDTLVLMDRTMEKVRDAYIVPGLGFHRCLIEENDSTVLLGTDIGLYRIIIRDKAIIKERLYTKMVYAILPGGTKNEYWFSTDYGLYRIDEDNQLTQYSIETGVQENEFNTNARYKSESGKLYFGGINGITAFYPDEVVQSSDSIRPYLSSVMVNNQPIAQYLASSEYRSWDLSPSQSNISVELLGKGRKAPGSYNYQYWMKGLNNHWVDLGNQTSVNFELAPGTYTFYYHIADNFNPDIIPENGFAVVIHPPVYKRWWFITIASLAIAGAGVYLFIQHKKKQTLKLMYEYQLNEKLQKERMRISRELHDNIGAQMATVKRNINFLVSHFDNLPKEQVENKMRDLEGISTQINQELRDTIWATQNEHISVADFITRLKNYVFQTLGHESSYRVIYEEKCDKEVILGPFLALNLHRICQETLNNAFKHAGATELIVCFEGDNNFFKVTIRDNGAGFDVNSIHEGYGLSNIKHRSAQIGATIYFNRGITKGSSIEIVIEKLERSNNVEEK